MQYEQTLARVETYFDKTATKTWERLTSDAPVSRIRQTVRLGRDQMRARLISALPADVRGLRILDAGCGVGQLSAELARAGAQVVGVDISPALIDIAKRRLDQAVSPNVQFIAGDMLTQDLGEFDYIVAMDSLIYYRADVLGQTLTNLKKRCKNSVIFTVAPKTPLLMVMWYAGKLAPRSDRSPVMVPHSIKGLQRHVGPDKTVSNLGRIHSGFYISQALEFSA